MASSRPLWGAGRRSGGRGDRQPRGVVEWSGDLEVSGQVGEEWVAVFVLAGDDVVGDDEGDVVVRVGVGGAGRQSWGWHERAAEGAGQELVEPDGGVGIGQEGGGVGVDVEGDGVSWTRAWARVKGEWWSWPLVFVSVEAAGVGPEASELESRGQELEFEGVVVGQAGVGGDAALDVLEGVGVLAELLVTKGGGSVAGGGGGESEILGAADSKRIGIGVTGDREFAVAGAGVGTGGGRRVRADCGGGWPWSSDGAGVGGVAWVSGSESHRGRRRWDMVAVRRRRFPGVAASVGRRRQAVVAAALWRQGVLATERQGVGAAWCRGAGVT